MRRLFRAIAGALLLLAFAPPHALAGTSVGQPFPSNLYTTPDSSQLTGLRVDLPQPNCATAPSDCADIALLDGLDGFNVQPRISIPFSGPIDLTTVSSKTIFLVGPGDHVVGINQAVWEPLTKTLHVESDELLRQHSTYLLVVTTGIHDDGHHALEATDFRHDLNFGQTKSEADKAYRKALLDALPGAMAGGVTPSEIAGASLFTTQSITPISERIRGQLRASSAPAVNFALGPGGLRTVFPLATVTSILLTRDHPTPTTPPTPTTTLLPIPALSVFPGSVGTIAFGTYASPDYETAAEMIPAYGTKTGVPAVQRTNLVQFTLFEPAGPAPAGGWPVVIFGHGFTDSKDGAPWVVASSYAHAGLATIAINVVGHGFGPNGTYTVSTTTGAPVTFPSGGRAVDQNGSGTFDSTEGVSAIGALALIANRDGLRQTVIDLMQLVHLLEAGVDVDGNAAPDLSTSRIYYAGQSFGGIYGVQILGLEPDLRAGVANVPGGSITEVARLGGFRPLVGVSLFFRSPSLYNANPFDPTVPAFTSFVENIPLRTQPLPSGAVPVLVDTFPGASAIQATLDNAEWAQNAGNPVAYAEHLTAPVIIQFARGDKTVPNPTTTAILRAGNLGGRATLYRNDLAFLANPAVGKNPHTFLTNLGGAGNGYALAAQAQMATFFASDGVTTIDPDGGGPFFETPTSMLPEDLAFIN
jgi:dienelactone hydrolase